MEWEPMCQDLIVPYELDSASITEWFTPEPWYRRVIRWIRGRYFHVQDIRHRIRDYRRLENYASRILVHASCHVLSRTNYELKKVRRIIDHQQRHKHLQELMMYMQQGLEIHEVVAIFAKKLEDEGND